MKEISRHWTASKNPRKQRKYLKKAPLHLRKKFVSANLSKDLRKAYKRRNMVLVKGDKIKVMRGQFKNMNGIVNKIDRKNVKAYVDGIEILRKDGTKRFCPLHTSNLQITELKLDDQKRKSILEGKNKK